MTTTKPTEEMLDAEALEAAYEATKVQPGYWLSGMCETAIRAYLATLKSSPVEAVAVKVKPLEWDETDERWWGASPMHGLRYEVRITNLGETRVRAPEAGGWTSFDGTLDEAKAVFQADFETRIRSALVLP